MIERRGGCTRTGVVVLLLLLVVAVAAGRSRRLPLPLHDETVGRWRRELRVDDQERLKATGEGEDWRIRRAAYPLPAAAAWSFFSTISSPFRKLYKAFKKQKRYKQFNKMLKERKYLKKLNKYKRNKYFGY